MKLVFLVNDKTKSHGNRHQVAINLARSYTPGVENHEIVEIKELRGVEVGVRYINMEEPGLCPDMYKDVLHFSFEGTRLPKDWIPELKKYRLILVPSKHTYDMFRRENLGVPLAILPHGYIPAIFHPKESVEKENQKITFLFNGGWIQNPSDRKNLLVLLKAWEKLNFDDAELYIKLNRNALWPDYNFTAGLKAHGLYKLRNVILDERDLDYSSMGQVYRRCDVLVSPSRAEGFNIPVLEGMACGLFCIVTGWGGHTDFCNGNNLWLDYELEDAPKFWYPQLYQGSKWATINQKDLEEKLKWCYDHRDEVRKFGADNPKLVEYFTYKNVSDFLVSLLEPNNTD